MPRTYNGDERTRRRSRARRLLVPTRRRMISDSPRHDLVSRPRGLATAPGGIALRGGQRPAACNALRWPPDRLLEGLIGVAALLLPADAAVSDRPDRTPALARCERLGLARQRARLHARKDRPLPRRGGATYRCPVAWIRAARGSLLLTRGPSRKGRAVRALCAERPSVDADADRQSRGRQAPVAAVPAAIRPRRTDRRNGVGSQLTPTGSEPP
jgi:hypothetical protein